MAGELERHESAGEQSFVLWVSGPRVADLHGEIECVVTSERCRFESSRELLQILASMLNAERAGASSSEVGGPSREETEDE